MVTLGNSSNKDIQDVERDGQSSHDREADERTSLLHEHRPPPNRDGYLDPDDPAVSPYNLWTVRVLRYLTLFFFLLNFVWWVLLLVSIFVSPPGLHTRGSGFFDFAFVTLTGGNLLVALLFFAEPSKAMRSLLGVVSFILLVDVIIIVSVTKVRQEEGPVGIASVVWTCVVALWCIGTDNVVASAKKEEEERLTGREETRRTLKQWLEVLFGTIILSVFVVIAVLMTGTLIIRARDASLEMSGERYRVDGGKFSVHLACVGNVTHKDGKRVPTILLESGENPSEAAFEPWLYSTLNNKTIHRYCYWDRPGYAWSDNAPSPHSAGMSARILSETLARAGEEGPWVLVSAGYGSIVSRIFASIHMHEVLGLLLVDPLHEDLLHRVGAPRRGFLLWAHGIISPLGLYRIPGALFNGRTREDRVYGVSAYQGGKLIKARLQENLVADSLTKNDIGSARAILDKKTPVVVVTSGIEAKTDRDWEKKQQDLSTISRNLVDWTVVNKAPHEVWQTFEGREAMEKGLKALMAATKPSK
ncbi:hypothetical protein BT63DRAFT_419557 [Microthyrium microscopicum]|uniref:Mitochondrial integral membrane protein-like protein n=1 Tax=Microthyrium microscopicum TaxID=703497 RepID=A0A6A6UR77_9PEZI|nr:hypothetical protein BT63DRAFT_419557 [Microthyrium microscopicum]